MSEQHRSGLERRGDVPGPVRVGVSSCLLGNAVRWDGGHKRDGFLLEALAPYVEWVPVCPEVEAGMGTPREPVKLARVAGELRVLGNESGEDWTRALRAFAARRVRSLEGAELCGYVLKARSPSCGLAGVEVWEANGPARRDGRGVFAAALLERFPLLPVEDESRLADASLREDWLERVFAYRRLRAR